MRGEAGPDGGATQGRRTAVTTSSGAHLGAFQQGAARLLVCSHYGCPRTCHRSEVRHTATERRRCGCWKSICRRYAENCASPCQRFSRISVKKYHSCDYVDPHSLHTSLQNGSGQCLSEHQPNPRHVAFNHSGIRNVWRRCVTSGERDEASS